MHAKIEIKVHTRHGYEIIYKIDQIVNDLDHEIELIDKCEIALKDCFRNLGISKRCIE